MIAQLLSDWSFLSNWVDTEKFPLFLNTEIYLKVGADKLADFKVISQGFLENDMIWSDTGVLISKNSCFDFS
jgi:hypothetical protein